MASLRVCAFVLAIAVSAPVSATDLYRCVSEGGAVSYQDAPCGKGSRLSKTIPVLVEPAGPELNKPAASRKKKATTSKSGAGKSGSKTSDARGKQRAACAQARKDRDTALDRMGLNRTFDQLRALDDEVQMACKGGL